MQSFLGLGKTEGNASQGKFLLLSSLVAVIRLRTSKVKYDKSNS